MPFFVYGIDNKTGEVVSRFFGEAATEAEARSHAERQGVRVSAVVPSHATSVMVLPERSPPPAVDEADMTVSEEFAVFNHTLEGLTPRVYVTYALIGANVLVFVLMTLFGADAFDPGTAFLLHWGADYGPQTFGGQSWRLLSSLLVHIGIFHLASNMIVFLQVAPTVERMLGNIGFLLTYLTAGLAGSLWALFYNPMQIHAGASGAIFGIYGALLALLLRERSSIPAHVQSGLRTFVLFFIAFNVLQSVRPNISLAAHVGGMTGGFLVGLLLAQPLAAPARAGRTVRGFALAAFGAVLFVGGATVVEARYPNLGRIVELLDRSFITLHKFKLAQKKVEDKQLSDEAFATLIEDELMPEWKSTRAAFASLTPVPPSLELQIAAVVNYMALRQQHWDAVLGVERNSTGREWRHSIDKRVGGDEIERMAKIGSDYIRAEVDLDFAKPDASARGDKIKRLQALAAQVKSQETRKQQENRRLKFDDFSAFLEREQLPAWRKIEQDLADLSPLPAAFEQDVAAILNHMHLEQDQWESRVAYLHYEDDERVADEKGSRADNVARAIRKMSGIRLSVPY
ncbi:MAG: rhomboid family intramembrane serine protease [Tahibacter sp.]